MTTTSEFEFRIESEIKNVYHIQMELKCAKYFFTGIFKFTLFILVFSPDKFLVRIVFLSKKSKILNWVF
jgi:hypothetical protein